MSACRLANSALLEANRLYPNGALCKCPDQQDSAQEESDIKHCFKNSAAFLFRVYQKSISRFGLIVHKRFVVHAIRYASGVPQNTFPRKIFLTKMMRGQCIRTFDLDVPRLGSSRSIFGTEQSYLFSAKSAFSIQPGGNAPGIPSYSSGRRTGNLRPTNRVNIRSGRSSLLVSLPQLIEGQIDHRGCVKREYL